MPDKTENAPKPPMASNAFLFPLLLGASFLLFYSSALAGVSLAGVALAGAGLAGVGLVGVGLVGVSLAGAALVGVGLAVELLD